MERERERERGENFCVGSLERISIHYSKKHCFAVDNICLVFVLSKVTRRVELKLSREREREREVANLQTRRG